MDYKTIDSETALQEACLTLAKAEWLAVDTEFMRERNYYPQLCLLQIGNQDHAYCIDPLAIEDLSAVFKLLTDTQIIKVFHAADQDMEVLNHAAGTVPTNIFDTQPAAALLGLGHQIGYAALVQQRLNIQLDKSQTRIDWSKRPLSKAALDYAAADVQHLAALYPSLREELESRGRLDWLQNDFDRLSDEQRYNHPPELAWKRIRGIQKLRPKAVAVAQALASWRESLAQKSDKPRGWILRDDVLLDLATRSPKSITELQKTRNLPPRFVEKRGDTILALIKQAAEQAGSVERPKKPKPLTPAQEATVDMLQAYLKLRSAELNISPAALASRKEVEALVRGEREVAILDGWRQAAIGNELIQALETGLTLEVGDGLARLKQSLP